MHWHEKHKNETNSSVSAPKTKQTLPALLTSTTELLRTCKLGHGAVVRLLVEQKGQVDCKMVVGTVLCGLDDVGSEARSGLRVLRVAGRMWVTVRLSHEYDVISQIRSASRRDRAPRWRHKNERDSLDKPSAVVSSKSPR